MKLEMIAVAIAIATVIPFASASHGTDTASCEGDGLYDGQTIHSAKNYMRCAEKHTTMHLLKDACQ